MPSMLTIRPVSDLHEVVALTGPCSQQAAVEPTQWAAPDSVSLVASTPEGDPAGVVLLTPDKRVAGKVTSYRLVWLYVAPEYRKQGVARSLLREAATQVAKAGANRVHVCIRPSNPDAIALFDQLEANLPATYIVCLTHGGF